MAYMCADSGNLMAIAQQVIQQQQQQQQQQRHHHLPPPPAPMSMSMSMPMPMPLAPRQGVPPAPASAHGQIPATAALPYGGGGGAWPHAEHFFPDAFVGASAADAVFSDLAAAADFDADGWMESLIGDAPVFADSDLDRLIFPTSPPPVPVPAPAPAAPPIDAAAAAAAQAEVPAAASLPQAAAAAATPAACSSPSSLDATCSAPILQSLLACSRAAAADPALAAAELAKVRAAASEDGDPAERVAFYFADALARRLACAAAAPSSTAADAFATDELTLCYKTLNDTCPYSKFAHLTANQAILEATGAATKIHIVDFGIVQGIQWAALLQALATRPEGKPSRVRISGVPSPFLGPKPAASLAATSARLRDFAKLLGVDFEFVPLLRPMHELDQSDFLMEPDEAVAVNFMLQLYHLLGDSDEPVRRVLRLAKSLNPSVVTLGEYEVSLNRAGFVDRFANALCYYMPVFESLDVAMARDSPERVRVERCMFGERIRRAVGPEEGEERTDRMAGSREWQTLMEWCGFEPVRLSNYAMSQADLLLWNYDSKYKYSLVELPPAFLSLAWEKRPLLTVSAWR